MLKFGNKKGCDFQWKSQPSACIPMTHILFFIGKYICLVVILYLPYGLINLDCVLPFM